MTRSRKLATMSLLLSAATGCPEVVQPRSPPAASVAPPLNPVLPAASVASEPSIAVAPEIVGILHAADRLSDDKELDEGRRPGQLLSFFKIRPGMRVAEVGAGTGYTSELLARAVSPEGTVYAQNSKFILSFAEATWAERLKRPAMKNVIRVDREFDEPLPEAANNLDCVLAILIYHDLYWMAVDRAKMNKVVWDSLKPGGTYGIVDHSALLGVGANEVKTLHRIEESELRRDIESAGFQFVESAGFLRNEADRRDWSASPGVAGVRRGMSDRFVLLFRKPG